jgi:hypothetical protein
MTEQSLQFLQKAADDLPPAPEAEGVAAANGRETAPITPEEVAERVYQLICRDLRWDREREGGW